MTGGGFPLTLKLPVGDWPIPGAVADLNGDGADDLVVANTAASSLTVLLNACER